MEQQLIDERVPNGTEYSYFGYTGSDAEEFLSILLMLDFEKNVGMPEGSIRSALFDPKYTFVGISHQSHP